MYAAIDGLIDKLDHQTATQTKCAITMPGKWTAISCIDRRCDGRVVTRRKVRARRTTGSFVCPMTIPCAGPAALADILGVQSIGLCTPLSSRKRRWRNARRLLALGGRAWPPRNPRQPVPRAKSSAAWHPAAASPSRTRVAGIRTAVPRSFGQTRGGLRSLRRPAGGPDLRPHRAAAASDEQCGLLKHIAARWRTRSCARRCAPRRMRPRTRPADALIPRADAAPHRQRAVGAGKTVALKQYEDLAGTASTIFRSIWWSL